MAMALAATVVNRKAMTATSSMPTTANRRLSMTPSQKNMNVTMSVITVPAAIILNGRSRSVRRSATPAAALPLSLCAAAPAAFFGLRRITAALIIGQLLMMPITPDMAMPPMPMLLP